MAPNIEAFLGNLARIVGHEVRLDLISDRPAPPALGDAFHTFVYPLATRSRGLRRLESARGLWHYARTVRPDVLMHVNDFETYGTVVTLIGRWARIPSIARYSGQVLSSYRYQPTRARKFRIYLLCNVLGQIALRWSNRILTLGPNLASELRHHGVPEERIAVIPQPIDAKQFQRVEDQRALREELGMPLDKRVILFVGRLEWLKGADTFLRIVPRVLADRRDLFFCFVGAGPYEEPLRALPGPVLVPGAVAHRRVARYFQAADLFVYPSRTDGLPTALLEAIASGIPVVSRDVGDVSLVTHNLFRDDEELVDFLLQPTWRSEGLPRAFDDARLQRQYLELFHQTAGQGRL